MNLAMLTDYYLRIVELLSQDDGEVTTESVTRQEELEQLLGFMEDSLVEKIDGYASIINHLLSHADLAKREAERIRQRSNRYEQQAKWLKDRLKQAMKRLGTQKIESPLHTVTICKNGGLVPLLLEHADIHDIPDEYLRIVFEPEVDDIRKALESGKAVNCCRLGERGDHVRIK